MSTPSSQPTPAPTDPGPAPGADAGFDSVLLDLDGVVYAGPNAVPGAVEALTALGERDIPFGFVTNNASRGAAEISDHLVELGLPSRPELVTTSALVAARAMAAEIGAGSRILVVGSPALRSLVDEAGFTVVDSAADDPDAVVQGFFRAISWHDIAEACVAVAAGVDWWATNRDLTMPTERGLLPGNGAFVRIVADTTPVPYPFNSGRELLAQCAEHGLSIAQLMMANERSWRSEEEVRAGLREIDAGLGGVDLGHGRIEGEHGLGGRGHVVAVADGDHPGIVNHQEPGSTDLDLVARHGDHRGGGGGKPEDANRYLARVLPQLVVDRQTVEKVAAGGVQVDGHVSPADRAQGTRDPAFCVVHGRRRVDADIAVDRDDRVGIVFRRYQGGVE